MSRNTGVLVHDTIRPGDTRNTFPTHESQYGKGGLHEVATIALRNAIPQERRTEGMLVYVAAGQDYYRLGSDLSTWTEAFSTDGNPILSIVDFGGVGDDDTDNDAAFAEAISTLKTAGGGTLRVPVGTFLVTDGSSILIDSGVGIHIIGDSQAGSIIKRQGNSGSAVIKFVGGTNNSLENLTVDCDGYDGRGVYVLDKYTTIKDVICLDCPDRPFGLNGGGNDFYGVSVASSPSATISGITKANPGVVTTSAAHGFVSSDAVALSNVVGMTEVNDLKFNIIVLTTTTFSIGVNTTGYTTYSYGGQADEVNFEPIGCQLIRCRVYNAGRTALSQKRMRNSIIDSCYVDTCYSEGVTLDKCDYTVVSNNYMTNVARTDSATAFPDKDAGSGYLDIGTGGSGGVGNGGGVGMKFIGNTINGVQQNITTVNDRTRAGYHFGNSITASFGNIIANNVFEDTKVGVLLFDDVDNFGTFNANITNNIFRSTGTADGTSGSFPQFGDVWIDLNQGNNHTVTGNKHPNGNYLVTDLAGNSFLDDPDDVTFTPVVSFGGASTGITYGTQRGRFQRWGHRVDFDIKIVLTSKGSSTGALLISGLPYTAAALTSSVCNVQIIKAAVAPAQPFATVNASAATLTVYDDRSTTASAATALTDAAFNNDTTLIISGTFEV